MISTAAGLWRRPAVRVALFIFALAVATIVVYAAVLAGKFAIQPSVHLPWPLVAAGFLFAELKVVDVHFRREKHSFSLSEFPAVIGLFTLSPAEYMLAVVTGTTIALLWSRQAPIKLAFNLVNFAAAATLTLAVFHVGSALVGNVRSGSLGVSPSRQLSPALF